MRHGTPKRRKKHDSPDIESSQQNRQQNARPADGETEKSEGRVRLGVHTGDTVEDGEEDGVLARIEADLELTPPTTATSLLACSEA